MGVAARFRVISLKPQTQETPQIKNRVFVGLGEQAAASSPPGNPSQPGRRMKSDFLPA
jgi:hypothetical protein